MSDAFGYRSRDGEGTWIQRQVRAELVSFLPVAGAVRDIIK